MESAVITKIAFFNKFKELYMPQDVPDPILQTYYQNLQNPDYIKTVNSFEIAPGCNLSIFENITTVAKCLTLIPHISKFSATSNQIGDDQICTLLSEFLTLRYLRFLNLNSNNISDFGAKSLSMILPSLCDLVYINLNGNPIGDEGMIDLGKSFSKLAKLHSLYIYNTKITPKGAMAFAGLLQDLKHLVTCYVDHEDDAKLQKGLCKQNTDKITKFYDQNLVLKILMNLEDTTGKTLKPIYTLLTHSITPKLMENHAKLDKFVELIQEKIRQDGTPLLWYEPIHDIENQLFPEVTAQEEMQEVTTTGSNDIL